MSLAELLVGAKRRLATAGLPSPEVDAELLFAHLLGLPRGELIAAANRGSKMRPEIQNQLWELVSRRASREPLQHITGRAPFMTFEVAVGPGVFIPRPETESMVERALNILSSTSAKDGSLNIADLCSGSGVIALALARELTAARISAVEISASAVSYLEQNIASEQKKIMVEPCSVSSWGELADVSSFDMIISNPPYIPNTEVPNDREVRDFDPREALYGGADGLDLIREIASLSAVILKSGGTFLVEHSNLQGQEVREILQARGFVEISTGRDMAGRERFTEARKH